MNVTTEDLKRIKDEANEYIKKNDIQDEISFSPVSLFFFYKIAQLEAMIKKGE